MVSAPWRVVRTRLCRTRYADTGGDVCCCLSQVSTNGNLTTLELPLLSSVGGVFFVRLPSPSHPPACARGNVAKG